METSLLEICGYLFLLSFSSYFLYSLVQKCRSEQNLKEKYEECEWALVTGGSSGIGRAIVEKLATQGFNVVVVAYPDALLNSAVKEYEENYPGCQFIKVGVDLSDPNLAYMKEVKQKTGKISVSCVFNNAGYIKTGFFTDTSIESQLANHHCNATSVAVITHHFVTLMQQRRAVALKEKKVGEDVAMKPIGCVTFTSSPAFLLPCPLSLMYGATKSYLTSFASSLAAEVVTDGIEVCVIHPSPVASNFYKKTHDIDALKLFKSTATGPGPIVSALFQSIGRTVVRDQGYYPAMVKLFLQLLDFNLIADIIKAFAPYMGDFKKVKGTKLE